MLVFEMYRKRFKKVIYPRHNVILSERDRDKVWNFLMHEMSFSALHRPHSHKWLWLKTSGAYSRIEQNPGYYDALKSSTIHYPSPIPAEVEKDMRRTFGAGHDPEKLEIEISKMRNVLNAYGLRNPTTGYCQGFNYIVARLLTVGLNEEETFWILAQTIEVILPVDFYAKMIGLCLDQKVLEHLLI